MTRQCGDAVGSLTDDYPLSLTGESSRGGCKFLLDKCVDQRNDISKFCFGSLPSDGMKRGNAQTVLLKQYYQCDHGPEDHRGLADLPPAKKQRLSKKQRGLNHKVRRQLRTVALLIGAPAAERAHCNVHYSLRPAALAYGPWLAAGGVQGSLHAHRADAQGPAALLRGHVHGGRAHGARRR